MTPNKPDLDRIEELAGRLRDTQPLRSTVNGKTDYDSISAYIQDAYAIRHEAASDLTALISYARELEGALEPFADLGELMRDEDGWSNDDVLSIEADPDYGVFAHLKTFDFRRAKAALSRTQK